MLSVDAQIRYLVQWFSEWSELQRSDFLPIVAEKFVEKTYMNGLVNNMSNINCQDKPMSLFQCRVSSNYKTYIIIRRNNGYLQVKLFKEWISQWNPENRDCFLKQIEDIDATFVQRLTDELEKDPQINGTHEENGDGELIED